MLFKYISSKNIDFIYDFFKILYHNYPLYLFVVFSFLIMYVEIQVEEKWISINYPFRIWMKKKVFIIDEIEDINYGGTKAEWLEVIQNKNGMKKKYLFEFFSFRYFQLRKIVEKIKFQILEKS